MKKGFTLIEMVIMVGIVALIAALALANFPSFRGRLALDRESGKLSLALRKAQQYSSGVKRFNTDITDPGACGALDKAQYPAYSVTISTAAPKEYDIYADPDCDRISGTFAGDLIESFIMEGGVSIKQICINIDAGGGCTEASSLDVWYIRPSPSLQLTIDGVPSPTIQSAKIVLGVEDGSRKSVIVRKTGQVSVQNEN